MNDITSNYHQDNLFSKLANDSLTNKHIILSKIVEFVKDCGDYGATTDEVEMALGLSHQTASARMTEAKAKGLLEWNGHNRPTRSGRKAAVLIETHDDNCAFQEKSNVGF